MKVPLKLRVIITLSIIIIMIIMGISPIGFVNIPGGFAITLMAIPVIAGTCVLGPLHGALFGAVFGALSFMRSFDFAFITDSTGKFLYSLNPVGNAVVCFVPRIIMGFLVGLIFSLIKNRFKNNFFPILISAASATALNGFLFSVGLRFFFGNVVSNIKNLISIAGVAKVPNVVFEFLIVTVLGGLATAALFLIVEKFSSEAE